MLQPFHDGNQFIETNFYDILRWYFRLKPVQSAEFVQHDHAPQVFDELHKKGKSTILRRKVLPKNWKL